MPKPSTNKAAKKPVATKKPTLSKETKTKFKKRLEPVEIKFGVDISGIVIDNEKLTAIQEQAEKWYDNDEIEGYLVLKTKEFGELIVALVETPVATGENEEHPNWGVLANWKSEEKFWYNVKCAEAPNNQLRLRMTEEVFENTAEEDVYLVIGALEVQWKLPKKEGETKSKFVSQKPKDGSGFEQHTLIVVDMIGG